jgi:hypothetical protein
MGLSWRGIRARVSTPALYPYGEKGEGGYKMGRVYLVTAESLAVMRLWAQRRNAGRNTKTIEVAAPAKAVRPIHSNDAADDTFWKTVRNELWQRAGSGDIDEGEAVNYLMGMLRSRPRTHDAMKTAWWAKNILSERIAA